MSKFRIFGSRLLASSLLFGSLGVVALTGFASTALADVPAVPFVIGRPNVFTVGVAEQDNVCQGGTRDGLPCGGLLTCPGGACVFQPEAVNRFQIQDGPGNPYAFNDNEQGDVLFIEEGFTSCPTPIVNGQMQTCASELMRFVNVVNGSSPAQTCTDPATQACHGEIWVVMDLSSSTEGAFMPALPATPHRAIETFQELGSPNPGNVFRTSRTVKGTSVVVTVTLSSDTNLMTSDTIEVKAVPAVSPAGLVATSVLLGVMGLAFVTRRRRSGAAALG